MRNDVADALMTIMPCAEPGSLTAEFCFDPALAIFQGHFPGRPILPGILQIEMVRYAVEVFTGNRYGIDRVSKAKFTGEIIPREVVGMDAAFSIDAEVTRVNATLHIGQTVAASISMILKKGTSMHDRGSESIP